MSLNHTAIHSFTMNIRMLAVCVHVATCTHTANFGHEHFNELPEDGPMDGPKHVGVFFKKVLKECFKTWCNQIVVGFM
jgi:hypothetical protein